MGPGEDTTGERIGQRGRVSVAPLVLLGVLAAVVGVGLGLLIDWFPTSASKQAEKIDTLWDVLLVVSIPIFVLVLSVTLYSVWRFRMRPGQELEDGPPIHGNTRLEVIWTLIPAVLILGLCVYAYSVLTDIEEAQASEQQVKVTGQQFAWTFEYPGPDGKPIRSTRLYLEQGRPVRFAIRSLDVIHDFWVPEFRVKIDAVPGITTHLRVTPTRAGTYPVVCNELCGIGHAYMRATAIVLPKAQYERAIRQLGSGGAAGGGGGQAGGAQAGGAAAGKGVFTSQGCSGCHTLADAGATGTVGPDLDKVLKGLSAADVRQSIVDPNAKITKGYGPNIMPGNFGQTIPPDQLDALVKYLQEASR